MEVMTLQNTVIMAFRKRLKKRGYSNVSIKKNKGSNDYIVSGYEPLAHFLVSRKCSFEFMLHSFRF